ncbi:acyl-CoA thioester hydrolase/BAAT C-terminal domain-containing protein [Streptomyces sp. NL15-2K]|uniref:acyl-CoA thioester hydrolase/BAAT C-terminal domain-containing protein n=1 Tax=Streptomyces sp. NL15-2K TaxID=376149 RepID=UPI000F5841F8|nr:MULTISPECIES: acyl-CoA thioester hydrolase/BAAT C-terminal domain-containing protein [Actinomycetes]WKX06215.1 acyl-CoA thioester hydrolase/BAAT C-terminal domain-containing protein [Kutzneria buriramensis]GCB52928.1 palmitoyl-CoA hydrolase [Streptomyces sp. NL15-2K]
MKLTEHELTNPWEGVLITPDAGSDAGVLVLAGSSGRIERERARILAEQGITALAIRWFGGPGQPPGICEIPLETFIGAVDLLHSGGARRIGILGASKGAEAALLAAVHDPRVDVVIALSPTSRVWCNVGPGHDGERQPYRSSWTWREQPLPFLPMDDSWTATQPSSGPVAIRGWYELSEKTFTHLVPPAEIPVEKARADLLLVAGGDDAMWPSLPFAQQLEQRRRSAGARVRLIAHHDAGHRPRLPGESPASASPHFQYGGTPEADALLGAAAWPHILDALGNGG